MRFYQILPLAIEQGKKIRYRDWVEQVYIQWERCSSFFLNDKGNVYHFSSRLFESEGWEIYEEPKKVAVFFTPSKYNETNESGEIVKLYRIETLPVGIETKNAVMVPGTEREI